MSYDWQHADETDSLSTVQIIWQSCKLTGRIRLQQSYRGLFEWQWRTGEKTGKTYVLSCSNNVTTESNTKRSSAGHTGWTTDSISFQKKQNLSTGKRLKSDLWYVTCKFYHQEQSVLNPFEKLSILFSFQFRQFPVNFRESGSLTWEARNKHLLWIKTGTFKGRFLFSILFIHNCILCLVLFYPLFLMCFNVHTL